MNSIEKLKLAQFTDYLKPRPRDSHKGLYGHLLVIGGAPGYSGAVRLAAEAALRVGAGLVSIATHTDHALYLNMACPELICHGVETEKELNPWLNRATAVVIGPGLGQSIWAKKLLLQVIKSKKPLVLDADALNLLGAKPRQYANWILTPHPGEAARLLNTTSVLIQQDRLAAVQKIQQIFSGTCVLKGAGTLIATPDSIALCEAGNPGMASPGMGDVLSGVIGGLVVQGVPLVSAAKLGVLIHAMAGDLAAKEGERGMIASDLMLYLRCMVNL